MDLSSEDEAAKKKPNMANLSNGFIIQTYWDLLEEELKPKGNKILSILELLSDRSKQGSKPLNEWLSYVFNLVEVCGYGDSKNRIIRDILIKGCASDKARESIIRKGDKIKHSEVIEILQTEDATSSTYETLKEFDSTSRQTQLLQFTTLHMRSPRNPSRIQILMIPVLNVSGVVNPSAKSTLKYVKLRMFTVMSVVSMVTFRLFAKA